MERTEIIHGHGARVGLLIARPECFALGKALIESSEPQEAVKIKERAMAIIGKWLSDDIRPSYPIDEKVISLGLRRLGRFGIAAREGEMWQLTEPGQRAVEDASTPP